LLLSATKNHTTKTIKFSENKHSSEIGERLKLQEIEDAFNRFKICPKCKSREGFWLGLKNDHAHAQCKCCGTKFELFELFPIGEGTEAPRRLKFFRR